MPPSFKFGTWYPIETAPHGEPILTVVAGSWPDTVVLNEDGETYEDADENELPLEHYPITHWMPLPPDPRHQPKEEVNAHTDA